MKNILHFKKIVLSIIVMVLYSSISFGQTNPNSPHQHHAGCAHETYKSGTPRLIKPVKLMNGSLKSSGICASTDKVPIIIHEVTNIETGTCAVESPPYTASDAQCMITKLNQSLPFGDIFVLAKKDKDGNRITGVTRKRSDGAYNAVDNYDRGPDLDQFPPDQYLNIWIVKSVNAIGSSGLAWYPQSGLAEAADGTLNLTDENGVLMATKAICGHQDYDDYYHGTLPHEVGHYLGLPHVWSTDNTAPGPGINCDNDDGDFVNMADLPFDNRNDFNPYNPNIAGHNISFCADCLTPSGELISNDTQPTSGSTDVCSEYGNDCGESVTGWDYASEGYHNNFMDYTDCPDRAFTPWQECIMKGVLFDTEFGRGSILTAESETSCAGCAPTLYPEETTFFESSSTPGTIANNTIVLHLLGMQMTNPTEPEENLAGSYSITITDPQNPSINYDESSVEVFHIQENNTIEVRMTSAHSPNIGDPTVAITFNQIFSPAITNATVELNIDYINEAADCDIDYKEFVHRPTIQLEGFDEGWTQHPTLGNQVFIYVNRAGTGYTLEILDDVDNRLEADYSVFIAEMNNGNIIPDGSIIGAATTSDIDAYNTEIINIDPPANQYSIYGYMAVNHCGAPFYGWIRLFAFMDECGDKTIQIVDAASSSQSGIPIEAGKTSCECALACSGDLVANSGFFVQNPSGDYEDVVINYFPSSPSCSMPVIDYIQGSTGFTNEVTHTQVGNTITLSYTGNAPACTVNCPEFIRVFFVDSNYCLNEAYFDIYARPFVDEDYCENFNLVLTGPRDITVESEALNSTNHLSGPFYFHLEADPTTHRYSIQGTSWYDVIMPSANPFVTEGVDLSTLNFDNDINQVDNLIIDESLFWNHTDEDLYIPLLLNMGCGNARYAYIHFRLDCEGSFFLDDIVIVPPNNSLTTGDLGCDNNNNADLATCTGCIPADFSQTFTTNGNLLDLDIDISNATNYRIEYSSYPFPDITSENNVNGQFTIPIEACRTISYTIYMTCDDGTEGPPIGPLYYSSDCSCSPDLYDFEIVSPGYIDNDVTMVLSLEGAQAYVLTRFVEGASAPIVANSQDGEFNFQLDPCTNLEYYFQVECGNGQLSDYIGPYTWYKPCVCDPAHDLDVSLENGVVIFDFQPTDPIRRVDLSVIVNGVQIYNDFNLSGVIEIPFDGCGTLSYSYSFICEDRGRSANYNGTFSTCPCDYQNFTHTFNSTSNGNVYPSASATNAIGYELSWTTPDGSYTGNAGPDGVFVPFSNPDCQLIEYTIAVICTNGIVSEPEGPFYHTTYCDGCHPENLVVSDNYDGTHVNVTASANNATNYTLIANLPGGPQTFTDSNGDFSFAVAACTTFDYTISIDCFDGGSSSPVGPTSFTTDCACNPTNFTQAASTNGSGMQVVASATNAQSYSISATWPGGGQFTNTSTMGNFDIPAPDCTTVTYNITTTCVNGMQSEPSASFTANTDCSGCAPQGFSQTINSTSNGNVYIVATEANAIGFSLSFTTPDGSYGTTAGPDGMFAFGNPTCQTIEYTITFTCANGVVSEPQGPFYHDTYCDSCEPENLIVSDDVTNGNGVQVVASATNAQSYSISATWPGGGQFTDTSTTGNFDIPAPGCTTVSYNITTTCSTGMLSEPSASFTANTNSTCPCEPQGFSHTINSTSNGNVYIVAAEANAIGYNLSFTTPDGSFATTAGPDGMFAFGNPTCQTIEYTITFTCANGVVSEPQGPFYHDTYCDSCDLDELVVTDNTVGFTTTVTMTAPNVKFYRLQVIKASGNVWLTNTTGVFTYNFAECDRIRYRTRLLCTNNIWTSWSGWTYSNAPCCDTGDLTITENTVGFTTTITMTAPNVKSYRLQVLKASGNVWLTNTTGVFTYDFAECDNIRYRTRLLCTNNLWTPWSGWTYRTAPCCDTGDLTITETTNGLTYTFSMSASNVSSYRLLVLKASGNVWLTNTTGVFTFTVDKCEDFRYRTRLLCKNNRWTPWSGLTYRTAPCDDRCTPRNLTTTGTYNGSNATIMISASNAIQYHLTVYTANGPLEYNNTTGVFPLPASLCEDVEYALFTTCPDNSFSDWIYGFNYAMPCTANSLIGTDSNELNENTESLSLPESTVNAYSINAFPNPFDREVAFTFELLEASEVQFQLYNTMGTLVISDVVHKEAGPTKYNVTNDLPEGAYYYRIFVNNKWQTGKIIKASQR